MNVPSVDPTPGLGFAAAFLGIAWITLGLRIYTRWFLMRNWWPEDTAMVICLPFYTIFGVATIETSRMTELGKDKFIPLSDITIATTWFLLVTLFYILTTLLLKLSIALFFVRVALLPWRKAVIGSLMILLLAASGWAFFLIIFHCGTFTSIQHLILKRLSWKCVDATVLIACVYTHASVVALVDWTFVLLPFAILRKARMERREKWIIGPLMALASIGGLASLVRFKYCGALGIKGVDILAGSANLNVWSTLEASIGVSAANCACLRPLFRHYASSLRRYVSNPLTSTINRFRTMTNLTEDQSFFSRWTVNDDEKTKHENTRHDSGASDQPLQNRDVEKAESPQLDHADFTLPDIARLSVLKIPEVETPRSENEAAMIYHTQKFDVPIVMDFSLAYPEASRVKL